MDYLVPEYPVAVSAAGMSHFPGGQENIAYLTLFFESRLIAHVHVNWLAPVKVRRTLIGGSRKMIVYDDLEPSEKVKVYDKGVTVNGHQPYRMLVDYRAGDMWSPQVDISEALGHEARHFIQCVEERRSTVTSGESGMRVVRLLEAASQSIAARGRVIELDLNRCVA